MFSTHDWCAYRPLFRTVTSMIAFEYLIMAILAMFIIFHDTKRDNASAPHF